ncbi:MAG TPA: 4-hydroxythreonine-4-phosphate dehydrogenase PdxA [Thermoanaerobaculia bacterium]|nr:4-hydroxythreonine-4-phosphate dehydrogenase PdxA [Thermoanaerobaculia bacterium]
MKPLAVTLGDPAGVGPEVVLKALDALDVPLWLFGSRQYTEKSGRVPANVRFCDVVTEAGELRFGEVSAENGRIALASIDAAVNAIERGDCSALVTAPIHKQSIAMAGSPFPGHTELLASRAGLTRYGYDYAMYFDSPSIRTVLLTVHLPLTEAIASIDAAKIAALADLTTRSYERLYGKRPRIGVAGVNPHAGESGRFGREEETIARGVNEARQRGLNVEGPAAADTIFLSARNGKYDVVMSMYHDQGLIAVKTLEFERSVNVTIGLPYLRCSVDHGTAFDIAGRGLADARPMRYAIQWAARNAERWSA